MQKDFRRFLRAFDLLGGEFGRHSDDVALRVGICYHGEVVDNVVGGIVEHRALEPFQATATDVAVKEQIDLMSRCWFSLTAKRTEPIEHEYRDRRTNRVEKIRITGSQEYGIATMHDQDLLIFVISHWLEAQRIGLPITRRVTFTPYQFFEWIGREPTGSAYQRLNDALHRLKTTNIETTIDYEAGKRRHRKQQFSWISEWVQTGEDGEIRGVEVVVAEWLIESIQDFHVLTLDKQYFAIPGGVERWVYLYARKATGGANGQWTEGFRSLYAKSNSQQAFKHYASALRKIAQRNALPGLRLEKRKSIKGEDMLFMERVAKREKEPSQPEQQLLLIEQSPLEEAWGNVLLAMANRFGQPTVNSWLVPLRLVDLENGTLTLRAPTKFIADQVESIYRSPLRQAWKNAGFEVTDFRFEVAGEKKAA